jgi:hypothetical protein
MHAHLPKPLHGWRAFVGEVGIIVLGVLIALGAEQLIEAIHWRSEVSRFKRAVDVELADTVAAYRYRIQQEPCVQRRIRDLQHWQNADRIGKPITPTGEIGRPSLYGFQTSVWKSSSPEIMSHLTMEDRQAYAGLYDFTGLVDQQFGQEEEIWRGLNAFNGESRFSPEDRRTIADLIYRVRSVDALITSNYGEFLRRAGNLGIKPQWAPQRVNEIDPPEPELCRPLFHSDTKTRG